MGWGAKNEKERRQKKACYLTGKEMAGVNGKGGGSTKKEKGRKKETPATSTGLFALRPPIS